MWLIVWSIHTIHILGAPWIGLHNLERIKTSLLIGYKATVKKDSNSIHLMFEKAKQPMVLKYVIGIMGHVICGATKSTILTTKPWIPI